MSVEKKLDRVIDLLETLVQAQGPTIVVEGHANVLTQTPVEPEGPWVIYRASTREWLEVPGGRRAEAEVRAVGEWVAMPLARAQTLTREE